jgi:hypothetical protein
MSLLFCAHFSSGFRRVFVGALDIRFDSHRLDCLLPTHCCCPRPSRCFGLQRRSRLRSLHGHPAFRARGLDDVLLHIRLHSAHRIFARRGWTNHASNMDHAQGLTKRCSQPLADAITTFDIVKPFRDSATLGPASGGSSCFR